MTTVETTRMSSKGQIVIPEEIRKRLGLRSGDKFLVVGDKDVVILKSISAPSLDEFDGLITKARKQAERAGIKRSDITEAVAKSRGRK
jgi:AbrB family looped-hinge helix DNA binding protein